MKSKQNQSPLRNKLSFVLFYEFFFFNLFRQICFLFNSDYLHKQIIHCQITVYYDQSHTHVHSKPISKIENSSKRKANIAKVLFTPVALYDFSLITTKCLVGTICLQKYFYSFFSEHEFCQLKQSTMIFLYLSGAFFLSDLILY